MFPQKYKLQLSRTLPLEFWAPLLQSTGSEILRYQASARKYLLFQGMGLGWAETLHQARWTTTPFLRGLRALQKFFSKLQGSNLFNLFPFPQLVNASCFLYVLSL